MKRVVAAMLFCATTPLTAQPSPVTCPYRWNAPVDFLTADGRHAYVESARAVGGRPATLFGVPAFFWATPREFDPPPGPTKRDTLSYFRRLEANHGYVAVEMEAGRAGRGIRPPTAKGSISQIVAAKDSHDRVHVVWLSDSTGRDEPQSVWYAERRSSKWSKPVEIFRADAVSLTGTGPVILMEDSAVHVLVSFSNRGFYPRGGSGIAHIVRRNGRWTSSVMVRGGVPSSPTGVLLNDKSLLMAFVAVDPTARVNGGSHVFVAQRAASGPAWTVRRVNWAGLSSSRWPFLFEVSAKAAPPTIALVWTVTATTAEQPDSLFIATSRDNGLTWSRAHPVELGKQVSSVTAVMDRYSRIHIVIYSQLLPSEFVYTTWSNERWSPLQRLKFGEVTTEPTFIPIGSDSLLLFWGKRVAASPASPDKYVPIGRYAVLTRSCAKIR